MGDVGLTTKLYQEDGIAVLDVRLSKPIGESAGVQLSFDNYYVHRMDCVVKDGEEWKPLSTDIVLMPSPHHEDGAQDTVHIRLRAGQQAHTFAQTRANKPPLTCSATANRPVFLDLPVEEGTALLRFILSQPSPLWKAFGVRRIRARALPSAASPHSASADADALAAGRRRFKHAQLQRVRDTLTAVSQPES